MYAMKPLSCDPVRTKGMSERLIISHYENNYGGAVKRLNLIDEQLLQLEFDKAAGFLINGLKREQLIAMNSMILHELFFDGLGAQSEPRGVLYEAIVRDFGSFEPGAPNLSLWGKPSAAVRDGCCCHGRHAIASWSTSGRPTIATRSPAARRSWR
jgi:Fe-Mn family superoxide dismutase